MSSHKDDQTLTRMVDVYGYVASNLVPEVLHELIEHVIVLFDRIFRFREYVLSKSLPCDDGISSRRCRAQQLVKTYKISWSPNSLL
jgi:uncharacterized FlgJ-related protein